MAEEIKNNHVCDSSVIRFLPNGTKIMCHSGSVSVYRNLEPNDKLIDIKDPKIEWSEDKTEIKCDKCNKDSNELLFDIEKKNKYCKECRDELKGYLDDNVYRRFYICRHCHKKFYIDFGFGSYDYSTEFLTPAYCKKCCPTSQYF